ncbi:MAG: AAA family ATPase [Chloroflexi bacterium]|nr:AAA family ATPase [Chloroflexota bacterium]
MKQALLLTGPPGSGKTTALRRALAGLEGRAGGFFTQELRDGGLRLGFEIVTLSGERGLLAHRDFPSAFRVGRYGVDLAALERLAVPSLAKAMKERKLVVIDEIGKMEILSPAFREAVLTLLESGQPVLGTVMRARHPWAEMVKVHPQVALLTVARGHQDETAAQVRRWLAARLSLEEGGR